MNNENTFKLKNILSKLIKLKALQSFKECRDQQKSRIKETDGLEQECISSSKDHPTSFF